MQRIAAGRRRWTALVLIAALAAAAVAPAAAGPQDRLRRNEEKLERIDRRQAALNAKEGTALDRLAVIDARRAEAEGLLERLDSRLRRLDADIRETRVELATAQHRLALISDDLLDIQGRLVTRTELFTERAVAAYMSGPSAYLDGLFESATLADALDWSRYQESALDSDSKLIEEIQVLRDETDARRALVELKREEIAQEKLKLELSRTAVASLRQEKAEVLAAREAAVAAKRVVVADIRANQAQLQRAEDQLERDSASIEALLSGSSSGVPGSGQLLWPANGPVTSPFGYRTHPIFGDTRLHSGIDIGAPYGAPVIAADGGTVVFAGVMSGYGNAIVVDHGGGLATTYNHLSALGVSDDQRVGRGQYIAAVGCTGYCTGPHLHFEVRVNGTPVDPMPYLR
jgi:murein DD-endopeptidase MepM/ murein hydrolase activator NlpD